MIFDVDMGILMPISSGDGTFVFDQTFASDTWHIIHNLNKHPSVTVVDSAGSVVVGEVLYINENVLDVSFSAPFSGRAYLN